MELQPAKEAIPNNYFLKGCNVSSIHDRQILESMKKRAIPETPNKKNVLVATRKFEPQYILSMETQLSFFLVVLGFFCLGFSGLFWVFFSATANKSCAQTISHLHYCIMLVNTELTAGEKASFIVLYMSNITATVSVRAMSAQWHIMPFPTETIIIASFSGMHHDILTLHY